jgi:hypothetical protein
LQRVPHERECVGVDVLADAKRQVEVGDTDGHVQRDEWIGEARLEAHAARVDESLDSVAGPHVDPFARLGRLELLA